MIIGVTGLIGSGKSEVASEFARQGAKIIDCDRIGREVVENDGTILYRLVLEFGGDILTKGNKLNRRQLGRLAFSSPEQTARLNAIVHPVLLKELDRRMADSRKRKYHAVVDAALLVNWGYHAKVDTTVLVAATRANRIARLKASGLAPDEIGQRMKSQFSESHLRRHADYVITNNKDLDGLRVKARKLYLDLVKSG